MRFRSLVVLILFFSSIYVKFALASNKSCIRAQCIVDPRYWSRSLNHLKPYLKKNGLIFVEKDPDIILFGDIKNVKQSPPEGVPCIILERHSASRISDSTISLMQQKKALAVFKNLCLTPREFYKKKVVAKKYYYKLINDYAKLTSPTNPKLFDDKFLKKIYCVPWDIHLSNFSPRLDKLRKIDINFNKKRPIDIFFVGYTHFDRAADASNKFYGWHRKKAVEAIKKIKGIRSLVKKGRPYSFDEYIEIMKKSKIVVSPWGFSEWCFRDVEAYLTGAILIKPDTDFVEIMPSIYQKNKTYFACKPDFSDLGKIVKKILKDYENYALMRKYSRNLILRNTNLDKLAKYIVKTIRNVLRENNIKI